MLFPSSNSHNIAQETVNEILNAAGSIRTGSLLHINNMLGTVSAKYIMDMQVQYKLYVDEFTEFKNIPGIGGFTAASLIPTVAAADLAPSAIALINACDAVVSNIESTLPFNAVLNDPPYVNGELSWTNFTTGQTSTLRTLLQAVVDTVQA